MLKSQMVAEKMAKKLGNKENIPLNNMKAYSFAKQSLPI